MKTGAPPTAADLSFKEDVTFPFVEDENCNITGYGHQDKAKFAALVNAYDLLVGGVDAEDAHWEAGDITHGYAVTSEDGERFHAVWPNGQLVTEGDASSWPFTALWGQR